MVTRLFNDYVKYDLSIKELNGRYRTATDDEILETALAIINSKFCKGTKIINPQATYDFLSLELAKSEHELFAVMWLDNQHHLIAFETLFRGTIDAASVYPREVVKSALRHNAAACIFCHNHPSGVSEPSIADKQITAKLKNALELVEIRVLDHVLVAERTYSFAEHGIL